MQTMIAMIVMYSELQGKYQVCHEEVYDGQLTCWCDV